MARKNSATSQPLPLVQAAAAQRKLAYAPYSKFLVGAAIVTDCGVFTGCNVENASYGATICAERTAIVQAVAAGARRISAVAVVAHPVGTKAGTDVVAPCGMCLQVMAEFCSAETQVYLSRDGKTLARALTFGELLPLRFDKSQLGQK